MTPSFFLHRRDLDDFILIFTMGKVASTPLMRSLDAVNIYSRHLHWVAAETQAFFERLAQVSPTGSTHWAFFLENRLNMRRGLNALRDPEYASLIKVITAIRAPVEQILSHYFQALPIFEAALSADHLEANAENIRNRIHESVAFYRSNPDRSTADLTAALSVENHDRVLFCWLVRNYLHWFDEQLRPFFPTDILAEKPQDGYQVADNVLILKFEKLSEAGERAVATFARRPRFQLARSNVGAAKPYGALYGEVANTMKFPEEFVERLRNSKYVEHFYSEDERNEMKRKWTRGR